MQKAKLTLKSLRSCYQFVLVVYGGEFQAFRAGSLLAKRGMTLLAQWSRGVVEHSSFFILVEHASIESLCFLKHGMSSRQPEATKSLLSPIQRHEREGLLCGAVAQWVGVNVCIFICKRDE